MPVEFNRKRSYKVFKKPFVLLEEYHGLSPRERESKAAERHGAVLVIGIGAELADGKPRPYDGWITENGASSARSGAFRGLNGDILAWDKTIGQALELSSMGIRVNAAMRG